MEKFKKCLPDIIAVVAFALIAFAYFFPADIEGRILYQRSYLLFTLFSKHHLGRGIEIKILHKNVYFCDLMTSTKPPRGCVAICLGI